MNALFSRFFFGILFFLSILFPVPGRTAVITPDFVSVPTGWGISRYMSDSFSNVGSIQGHSNVLGIGIGPNGATVNRPASQQANFYSTQGMGHPLSGGAGDTLLASLYVPSSWMTPSLGAVRTDMWAAMTDSTGTVADYPIIGFTNYGTGLTDRNSLGAHDSFVGFRIWNASAFGGQGAWYDLNGIPVIVDGWNTLGISFTGTGYNFLVNGQDALNIASAAGASAFGELLMHAFNFDGNTDSPGAVISPYTAYWSNAVPEPFSLALMGLGLAIFGAIHRRNS